MDSTDVSESQCSQPKNEPLDSGRKSEYLRVLLGNGLAIALESLHDGIRCMSGAGKVAVFFADLDDDRIEHAIGSLKQLLGVQTLEGKRFMDLGSGSGLFSLAAHRLGAEVVSIDYDRFSVACTEELRERYGSNSGKWEIYQGSVLDSGELQQLGIADVVYSWGVLHHTGAMKEAISNAADRTRLGGIFCLAIYNDQGGGSRRWLRIKRVITPFRCGCVFYG